MKIWKNKIKLHFVFWLLYFFLEVHLDFLWSRYQFPKLGWEQRFINSVLIEFGYLFLKIPLAYLLFSIAEKKISTWVKVFLYFLIFALAIVFHRIYVHDIFYPYVYHLKETLDGIIPIGRFDFVGVFNGFMDLIFLIGLFFGMEITRQKITLNEKINELTSEKLDNELRMLKAQINPHFLFNTLNNIYGLALKKSDETPDVILQLSKIMRYNIYEASRPKISIEKDIENIKDFIEIQKIRHYLLRVVFNESIDNPSQEISPLILIQFVENAFKYGVSESLQESYILLDLKLENKILTFTVENSKENNHPKDTTKLGLKNIKRQLELLYPQHILEISEKENSFMVYLKIDFNNE